MATQYIEPGVTSLTAPAAGDDIIILGGSATIATNLDWSGVTDAAIVEVSRAYNGQFGSSSAPFKARVSTRVVYAAQGGDMYWASDGSASDVSARLLHIGGGHVQFVTVGTITSAEIKSGMFTIATACVVTNLRTHGGHTRFYDDSSTDPTLVENLGGIIDPLERGATTLRHVRGTTLVAAGTNAFTTVDIYGSGLKIRECGTITTMNAMGGLPDISELNRQTTITTLNINKALPGAAEFLDHERLTIGTTNEFCER